MSFTSEQVEAGQAIYSKRSLAVYDFVVLGVSNSLLWQCSTQQLVEHYNKHVTANHLDVGVGAGYFLDQCRFPSLTPRVALMDLNSTVLEFAARRVARYNPETYCRNVLDPIVLDVKPFDSVGVNYLFHCLPGSIESKAIAFDHLKVLMNPNGIVFGSTLLQGGVQRNWFAKRLMEVYNKKGIFQTGEMTMTIPQGLLMKPDQGTSLSIVGDVFTFKAVSNRWAIHLRRDARQPTGTAFVDLNER